MSHQQARLHQIPTACERLGIGRSLLFDLIRTGQLNSVKVGKRRLIPETAIVEFIERLTERADVA
ncbi:helix-turn-helix domain-containing protein [Nocardia sp. NPDC049707]|uniref:helix-turn-helix domain-containing protein n=1 Tax=Nocardia sp. NPDC049707 TaxID=3154735 RepID=UPI003415E91C